MKIRSSAHFLFLGVALSALALATACGGGASSGPAGALPAQPPSEPSGSFSLVIKIPQSPSGSTSRRPNYISPNTQSIGVIVANQGMSPSPAVFTNISSCPLVSGVTTCTITVQAIAGSDTFTINDYSGTNGGGSLLSTGSITATIPASGAVQTLSVTLGGVVSSIAVTTVDAYLPLSQTISVNVAEKDASGATIVGTYGTPVTLSGTNLVMSPASLPDSTTASNVSVAWTQGYLGAAASTLSATNGSVTGTLPITPASGFAFYTTGTSSTNDWDAFKIVLGGDGNLYYSTIGPTTCASGLCYASDGGMHQFNPTTLTDVEVQVSSEPEGLTYAPDGSVWFGGGRSPAPSASPLVYRIPSTSFNAASLTQITVPGTDAGSNPIMRTAAADNLGNIWFADLGSNRYLSIPEAGPYTTGGFTVYAQPSPPAGAGGVGGIHARTVDFAGGDIVYGFPAGFINVVNPSTGVVIGQYVTNLGTSLGSLDQAGLYDAGTDGTTIYFGEIGDIFAAYPEGDLEAFAPPGGPFTTLTTVPFFETEPIVPSVGDGIVYYADYAIGGMGFANAVTGKTRMYPQQNSTSGYFYDANSVAALADGTAWFTCYGNTSPAIAGETYLPICLGHTVYVSAWGLWPGTSVALFGAGAVGAQMVGIMESPSADSGPFTTSSSNTGVCTVSAPAGASDHNFTITGVAAGACTVTVTDAHSVSQAINVTVTTTTGTVQTKRRGGIMP